MISTKDTEPVLTQLNLVLKRTQTSTSPTPLISWLPETQPAPAWIPLKTHTGVTKIMPVMPDMSLYPNLMQAICQRIAYSNYVEWQQQPYEMTGVEADTNTLHVIQIPLVATAPLPSTLGRAIHAQCFQWFANADAVLAQHLHQQESVPFTLGIKYLSPKNIQLRITLLKQELLAPLLWGLHSDLGSEITLAGVRCRLSKWIDILQASSFAKLLEIPVQNTIKLQFLSPTSFKQSGTVQPFPLPDLVFNGLLRRWNHFAPSQLKFPEIKWNSLVSAFELKTHALKLEGGAEIGSEGWVIYRFSDSESAKIATVLAHFAHFAGVGRKTTMGMGQTSIQNSFIQN
ncbi:CRISPR system precrRNA processing endoribonuclease RAMP protein Cas6 [Dendronalium sp. ChiSLP03b]|uniref:CRISPR system precrRNA processing endoribonuclease RAMP protein Cas6 n=1 Tax=Dendronalium sp. ChiSLP03b TaxID=3075381 RepID=UPI002AD2A6C5|nr:CRISPR system precrRNA processing endoribonuclease RAMP protein Cas6 [Dendronalium sp. ChiSLP03b]MDZ8206743.1 CRISPR system precrRNA processing endoribonuclease RAMP protein Cas6 [Dendronalium sp. ChiSLP03b]